MPERICRFSLGLLQSAVSFHRHRLHQALAALTFFGSSMPSCRGSFRATTR